MLGLLGLVIVLGTGVVWIRLIQNVAIPRRRAPYLAAFVAGGLIGLAGVFQGGLLSVATGGLAAFVGLVFAALRLQSGQRPNRPAVSMGEPMLAASAPDENGVDFALSSLRGKPYLLKFFRGHW